MTLDLNLSSENGENLVNSAETSSGIEVTGSAEGSSFGAPAGLGIFSQSVNQYVNVTLNAAVYGARLQSDGSWAVHVPQAALAEMVSATGVAVAVDAAAPVGAAPVASVPVASVPVASKAITSSMVPPVRAI